MHAHGNFGKFDIVAAGRTVLPYNLITEEFGDAFIKAGVHDQDMRGGSRNRPFNRKGGGGGGRLGFDLPIYRCEG